MHDSVTSAAASGDPRSALEALRDRLAAELETATGPVVAALSKELRATISEIESLPGGKEVSTLDDLAKRRAARRADSTRGEVAEGR